MTSDTTGERDGRRSDAAGAGDRPEPRPSRPTADPTARRAASRSADDAPRRVGADPVRRTPGLTSAAIAIALATAASVLLAPPSVGSAVGATGTMGLAVGVLTRSRRRVTLGTGVVLAGVVLASATAVGPAALVAATLLALLAWDAGRYGITVGEQLGRDAATARLELAHVAASAVVGTAGAAVAYGTFLLVDGGATNLAVVVLLVGVVLLLSAVR